MWERTKERISKRRARKSALGIWGKPGQSEGWGTERPQEAGGDLDKHFMSLYGTEVGGGPEGISGKRYYRLRTSLLSLSKQGLHMHIEWCGFFAAVSPFCKPHVLHKWSQRRPDAAEQAEKLPEENWAPLESAPCLPWLLQPWETAGLPLWHWGPLFLCPFMFSDTW